ncbi:MAG: hypothetical protein E7612_10660 [Ruminococcaceae bacterium]|nr:hypothetical protein [Oscillospiraceae bacterium]
MKKTLSVVLLCVIAVSVMLTLVSCGGLSGTYDGPLFDIKFKGDKATIIAGDKELTGTYEIKEKDDKKTISFDFVDASEASEDEKYVLGVIDSLLKADLYFKEDGKQITIGVFKFTKK